MRPTGTTAITLIQHVVVALGAIALFSLLPAADPVSGPRPASERRPSILLLIADDLADWHLGAYGNREIRTPNLDRLAAEGIRMAGSFCATPICSPSRATLFTGRLPPQHGIHCFLTPRPGKDPPQGQAEVPESFRDEVMISDLLAGAGYRTGYIGKWHMGDDARPQHGFQEWCARIEGSGYRDPVLSVNGTRVEEKGYTTEVLTRRAVGYIRARAEEDGPWFLVVSYPNPHLPYEGHPQRYYDLYRDVSFGSIGIEPLAPNALRERSEMRDPVGNLRKAAASTTALDDQVPALLEALEETSQRARTLVVFTGDNGFLYGRHGAWSKGYATNPINLYEEVVRVPMIFSWPGGLPGGRVLPELVSFYDLLPTLCEAAGVEPGTLARLVKERDLPGRSYWPILTGRTPDRPWENAVFFFFRNVEGIRDQRFKLVLRNRGEGPEELFDLKEDPRERRNLSGAPELAAVEQAMRERLRGWMDRRRPAADPPAREDLFISGEDGYAAYRIPALLAVGKGVLLAFCEGRKRSFADDGDIDILLRRSEDGGRSWGRRILVRDDGPDTAGNPCPVLDPSTGTVWLLYCRNNRRVFVTSSADGGTSWSPPAEITAEVSRPGWTWYATGPGHGVRLRSGRLLIPCDHKTENATRDEAHLYCSHVIWSDDGGASWKPGGVLGERTNECAAVELEDGSVYLNMRSYHGKARRAFARSGDGGATWPEVELDPTLIEPTCQASLARLTTREGHGRSRVLFSNPASTERKDLTVRLSYDECRTWPVSRLLQPGMSAYSDLAVGPGLLISCLYERGEKRPYERITLARFTLAWLTGGADRAP